MNLIFLGGIHGSGKDYVLDKIASKTVYYKLLNGGLNSERALKVIGALNIIGEKGIRTYKGMDKTYHRIRKDIEKVDFNDNFFIVFLRM